MKNLVQKLTANAVELIRDDHVKAKKLFRNFEIETDAEEREEIADDILSSLVAHAEAEEKYFYPEVAKVASIDIRKLVTHGEEEHEEMKRLIEKIKEIDFATGYETLISDLRDQIEDHITEEEGKILPEAEVKLRDHLGTIGKKMLLYQMALLGKEKVKELGR